ncbi:hypothetical protein E2R68_03390 [Psychromonas sp. RZ22]|uniref:outer membrane beta-barrel protein n=1 Tax=Psychromonas algarum TaxID=2555643 RepID=UPI0010679F27|nr:outer membrane beta-barrel protein [Psychromonas sp. RZ22]TEW56150.1 hypothetical protein E2R68_03390 [Psychromonas sp. RZ22]
MKSLLITLLTIFIVIGVEARIFEPAPVKLTNSFIIVPQLDASTYFNDNIYTSEFDTVSSAIYIVKPLIAFGIDDGINRYGGEYELISGTYENSSDDNYLDQKLALYGHTEFTDRHRTDINIHFNNLHEARGSNLTESNQYRYDAPIKYNTLFTNVYYQYGLQSAILNVGGGIQYYVKEYQNFTDDTEIDDLSKWTFMLDGDYQIGAVTYFTVDLSTANGVYQHQKNKNNRDNRFTFGARWEGLGKTIGKLKLGYQYKEFDDSSRENFAGNIIDLGVTWQPVMYSSIEMHVNRAAEDSDTVGDYILAASGSVGWLHNWTEKIDSDITLLYSNEDYIGADREDKTLNTSLYLSYEFTRWFKMRTGYEFTKKGSNVANIRYDQNAVNLGITVAL